MPLNMVYTFCVTSIVFWIIIPVASLYHNHIYVSEKLPITGCQQINITTYQCGSISELFQQLSNCCDSTDVSIEPGTYDLAMSHVLADLDDIRIRSETNAVIQCAANVNGAYDFDTGIAFMRVKNLVITNITIIGCGMKHITTNDFGEGRFMIVRSALFIQNSTDISLDNITVSESNGIGLLIYDTNGSVSITKSSFTNNSLNSLEQSIFFTGGGGIYIEFTRCTPGMTNCISRRNGFNKQAQYTIDQCVFQDNVALYQLNASTLENITRGVFITFGTGGGLSIWLYGNAQNNSFEVTSTSFISNAALYGGGLYMHNRHNTRHNSIQVMWCNFTENFAKESGGGLIIGYAISQNGGQSLFNTYVIAKSSFKQNRGGIGGGISFYGSLEPRKIQPTNNFEVHSCSFKNNGALYGAAIQVDKYFDGIDIGTRFTLILNNCSFFNNNLHENYFFNSSSVGAVAMSGVDVEFRGTNVFSDNNSTALVVDGAFATFSNNSMITFQNNSGLHGGAISLVSGARISVYPNTTVIFLRNRAVQHGGAIYVELSTPFDYLLSRACFIRYYSETVAPSDWLTNFTFIDNTAGKSSNTIFTNTLNPCLNAYSAGIQLLYNAPFHHYSPINDTVISTSPDTFKFLSPEHSMETLVPGEVFDLPVQLLDELGQVVSSAMFIATCSGPPSPYITPTYQFTNGSIQIAGTPGETCQLQLQTDTDYQISTTVQITLLNCPPGFVYNSDKAVCECIANHDHPNSAIIDCETISFQAYFNRFYWIGYASDDADADLLISPCPNRYCYDKTSQDQLLPRVADKSTLEKFVCGSSNRKGLLCGQCIEGYSVAMNSPTFTCDKCKTPYLGILIYLLLSYIIPVTALFYIIMAYNIRMTTGPIEAFLFFSQVITSQYRFVFDYSVKANSNEKVAASNIVILIYSVANLEFFQHNVFSYCLFPNAGTVDILAFNLILSFYPFLLVLMYFLLRRYCTGKLQCSQWFRFSTKSVTHGVCAFLVLCFARINILAFGILKSADINYIDGRNFRSTVYLQGTLKYFGDSLHSLYAIGSVLAIVTVIFIPTLILVFHPIMIWIAGYFKWGDTKYVTFINKILFIHKLKPVLDSFQGDYKDNLSFFAGLHSFLYRIIFFCIVVATSAAKINESLLVMIAYFMIILLIHMLVMPFKKHTDNAFYSLVYFLLLSILILELYLFSTDEPLPLDWLEIILQLTPFMCVVVYCSWKILIICRKFWKKHFQKSDDSHLHLDDYRLLDFPERICNEEDGNQNSIENGGNDDDDNSTTYM